MGELKCTFKPVNGDKTGVYCRVGPAKSHQSVGILYMKKCPDGKSFIINDKNQGNSYYILIDPPKYGLPKSSKNIYVYISDSFIKSKTKVQEETKKTTTTTTKKTETQTKTVKRNAVTKSDIDDLNVKPVNYTGKIKVQGIETAKDISKNN